MNCNTTHYRANSSSVPGDPTGNSYTGVTTITEGTLRLQGIAFSLLPRTYSIGGSGTLNIDGNTGYPSGTTVIDGTGTLRVTNGIWTNEGPNSPTGDGRFLDLNLGSGGFIDVQAGARMVNGGWSSIRWGNNLADLRVDGQLDLWDGQTARVDALTGSGLITSNQNPISSVQTLVVGVDNGSGIFTGAIQNGGRALAVTKAGSGTQVLNGPTTYTGPTVVEGGTLIINGTLPGANTVTVADGAGFGRTLDGTTTMGSLIMGVGSTLFTTLGGVPSIVIANNNGFTANGAVTVNVGGGALAIGTYPLVDYSGTLGGSPTFTLGTLPSRVLGNLVMNAANTSVDLQVTGSDSVRWTGAQSSVWSTTPVGGNQNWVLQVAGGGAEFVTADTVRFTDSASNGTMLINAGDVSPSAVFFDNSTARNYTLGGTNGITGGASLTKSGNGTLTINNTNSFTGQVAINGGTVIVPTVANIGVNSALGAGADLSFNGGILEITGAGSTNRTITLNGAGGTVRTAADVTFAGALTGSGGLTKVGPGMLALLGINTYTGQTTVSEGILRITGAAFSTAPRNYAIAGGAVLNIDGNTGYAQGNSTMTGTGTLRITNGAFINEAPNAGGPGKNLNMDLGAGALIDVQAGAKMTNGGWANINWTNNKADLLANGTFDVWDGSTVFVGGLSGSGLVTSGIGGGSTHLLTVGANNGSGTFMGTIENGVRIVAFSKIGSGTQTLTGANTFSGPLTVDGGTLQLNGPNTYTSATTVNAGSLILGAGGSIPNTPSILLAPGAVFNATAAGGYTLDAGRTLTAGRGGVAGSDIIGNLTSAGTINVLGGTSVGQLTIQGNLVLTGGTVLMDLSPATSTYDRISASGSLDLQGTTTITPNIAGMLAAGSYTLISSGSLVSGGVGNLALSVAGGTSRQTLALDTTTTPGSVLLKVTGSALSLVWAGPGDWDVATSNNWVGGEQFFNFDSVTFDDTSTNTTVGINSTVNPGITTVDTANTYTFTGGGSIGSGALIKAGTGRLVVNMANTYGGGTIVRNGTLQLDNPNGVGTGTITLGDAASTAAPVVLQLSGQTYNNNVAVVAGGPAMKRIQTGGGTTTLTGAYTLNNSTLEINTTIGGAVTQFRTNGGLGAGTISGTGTLVKTGPGQIWFGAQNQVVNINLGPGSLIDVQEGILRNEWSAGIWTNNKAALNIASGALVQLWDSDITVDALTGAGVIDKGQNNTHTLNIGVSGGSGTFTGTIKNDTGSIIVTKHGAGTQTLSGPLTYSGATTVNAGTLIINSTLPNTNAVTVADGAGFGRTTEGTLSVGSLAMGVGSRLFATLGLAPSIVVGNANGFSAGGAVTVNVAGQAPALGTYTLVDYSGTLGGSPTFTLGTLPSRVLGNLVMNASNSSVDLQVTGADSVRWTGAQSSVWSTTPVGGNQNWVLQVAGGGTEFLTADTARFTDSAVTGTVLINAGDVAPSAVIFDHSTARNYTLGGTNGITGAATLTKSGNGILTINNTNSFTGQVAINGGTIIVPTVANSGVNSALGAGANLSFDGGTLDITGTGSTNRTITLNAGGGTVRTAADVTFAGGLAGSGGLTKVGPGVLALVGNNTYTGQTTVSEGILRITGAAFSAAPRNYAIAGGAVLNIDGNTGYALGTSTMTGTGTLRITNGAFINEAPNEGGPGKNLNMELGAGALIDVQAGAKMTNGGWANIEWANNKADLRANGTFDLWDGKPVFVGGLSGSGLITTGIGGGETQLLSVGANNGSGTFSGTIVNGSRFVAFTKIGSGTQVLSGANTFSGPLTVNGGTLQLDGSNAYTGTTTVSAGSLILGAGGSIPNTPAVLLSPGAIFNVAAAGGYTLEAGRTLTAGRGGAPANDIIGNLTSGGTIHILSGTNPGQLTIQGNLALTGGAISFELSGTAGSSDRIVATGSLSLSGTTTITPNISGMLAAGAYPLISAGSLAAGDVANLVLTVGGGSRQTLALDTTTTPGSVLLNVTGNALSLVWAGPGDWDVMTSANWVGGQQFFNSDSVTFDDTSVNTTVALGGIVNPGAITVNTAGTYTFNGPGSIGSGALLKTGSGTLVISAANNFGGGAVVRNGTLQLDNGAAAGTGTITLGDATSTADPIVLQLVGQTYNNNVTVAAGPATKKIQTGGGTTTLTGGYTLNNTTLEINTTVGGAVTQFRTNGGAGAGTISGTGTIVKTGPGQIWFGAQNQIVNISLGAGSLIDVREGVLRNEWSAGIWTNNKASLNIESAALVQLWDADITVDALTGSGVIDKGQNNTHTLNIGVNGGSGTFSGTIKNDTGSIVLTKLGAGTQTLSGVLTYSGATTVSGGTLKLVDPANFNSASVTVATGAKLDLERAATDFNFSKPIGGAGSLAITAGGGTITLSGNHGLTGATTVNSGTLNLSGSLTASATSVEAFATVKGDGHVGQLRVKANAALSPGALVGTLFADGGAVLEIDSLLNFDLLGSNTTVGGGVNDLFSVTGNLTLDGTLNVTETVADSFLTALPGQKWRLMNYTGTLINNGLDLSFSMPALSSDYTFVVDTSTANQVNLMVVPEPGAVLSMLGGLGVIAAVRRRRK